MILILNHFTGVSDGEFPPEPDSDDSDTEMQLTNVDPDIMTVDLVDKAIRAGKIRHKSKNNCDPSPISMVCDKAAGTKKRKCPEPDDDEVTNPTSVTKKKLTNSDIFPTSVRPDWLLEDRMINTLPRATVATIIAQTRMTEAINKQNKLREEKADKSKGGLRKDEEIKTVKIKTGDDDATSVLHPQRFLFRTPLTKPETYWNMVPVKWPETTKRLQLVHLGLDTVIAARTKELVHDRADGTINIKMFSPVNVMIGREGDAMTSKFKHETDGVKVEMLDKWADLTSIGQLEEAIENLVRLWSFIWPFDYGPSNIKGVLTKHRYFASTFESMSSRKKILEDFINRALWDNAVRAGQKLPPMTFKEVEDRAKEVVDRKSDYNRVRNLSSFNNNKPTFNQTKREPQSNQQAQAPQNSPYGKLQSFLKTMPGGDDLCIWFNLKEGCHTTLCPKKHQCCKRPKGQSGLCKENHAMYKCIKN